jgi:predicted nucleic acid-binding protein
MSAADIFFDTNVLLYILSKDVNRADHAERLLRAGGTISIQVLNEFAAVAAGKLGMRLAEVTEILSTIRALCIVKPLEIETHDLGLQVARRYRFSIYDSMIVAAALRAGCATLLSEDFRHGQAVDSLTIRNPFIG